MVSSQIYKVLLICEQCIKETREGLGTKLGPVLVTILTSAYKCDHYLLYFFFAQGMFNAEDFR